MLFRSYVAKQSADIAAEEKAAADREMAGLKNEWRGDYDAKIEMGRRAAKALGVDKETIDYLESGMGAAKVLALFEKVSKFFREGDFIDGAPANSGSGSLLERLYPADVAKDRAARGG